MHVLVDKILPRELPYNFLFGDAEKRDVTSQIPWSLSNITLWMHRASGGERAVPSGRSEAGMTS